MVHGVDLNSLDALVPSASMTPVAAKCAGCAGSALCVCVCSAPRFSTLVFIPFFGTLSSSPS